MKRTFRIYLVHPMSGLNWKDVEKYYTNVITKLEKMGYLVLHPMCAKGMLSGKKFNSKGEEKGNPIVIPHAIVRRDIWMVKESDIVFADLTSAKEKSIGSISEIAVACSEGKHVVGVMEKGNVHEHTFMKEQFDVIYDNLDDALKYLERLIRGAY